MTESRPGQGRDSESGGGQSLRSLLSEREVVIPLPADTLAGALGHLGQRLVAGLPPEARDPLLGQLNEVAAGDLVPLGQGAVLAHLRSTVLPGVRVVVGVAKRPLEFAPETAKGARVLILVVSGTSSTREYLQTLAALGRVLRGAGVTDRLAAAGAAEELLSVPELDQPLVGPRLRVQDIMTARVVAVAPDASLAEALRLMIHHRLRALPVVNERREVLGVIADRQVMEHYLPRLGSVQEAEESGRRVEVAVREIMDRSVLCVKGSQSVWDVAALMINKDVERFPVCEDGALVGFCTRGDVIRRLLGPQAALRAAGEGNGSDDEA
ncbi:MAG: CBS domain-containing protein [Gemmatimonadota bacterium]